MSGMYKNKKLNGLLIAGSCVAGIALFLLIRQQTAISDRQVIAVDDPASLWRDLDVR